MEKNMNGTKIGTMVTKAIGLAMGVAVVALNLMGQLDVNTGITMLGFGLCCLAISTFDNKKED